MTRVMLADDHAVVRTGLSQLLATAEDIDVVGTAADGAEAVTMWREHRPDVVLMDLSMPDMDGLQAIPAIRSELPDAAIVVLSGFSVERMAKHVRSRGADGYVEKGTAMAELREATRRAVAARRKLAAA